MATTQSPMSRSRLRPIRATGKFAPSIFTTATSVRASSPSSRAGKFRPSRRVTTMESAPVTTCWLVMIIPSAVTMKPEPRPWTTCSAPGGRKNRSNTVRGRARSRRTTFTLTTAGAIRAAAMLMAECRLAVMPAPRCCAARRGPQAASATTEGERTGPRALTPWPPRPWRASRACSSR